MADGGDSALMYWAGRPPEELLSVLKEKEVSYYGSVRRRGLATMWRVAYAQYYGLNPDDLGDMATQTLSQTGEQGAYTRFRIGEVRSFIKQQNAIALGERPAFQCLSSNADYQSQSQVEISDIVVSYLYRRYAGEERERDLVEAEGVVGMAYAWLRWDFDGGDMVTVEAPVPNRFNQDGTPATAPKRRKSGAPKLTVLYPWDAYQDVYARDRLWMAVRERCSKWEVAAKYPELYDRIVSGNSREDLMPLADIFNIDREAMSDDDCIVKHFYHVRCAAMPKGRYVGMVGDVVLWDEECPTEEGLPIIEMTSGKFMSTQLGYADSWDLCAIQEMIDQMCSDTGTNLSTFGRQCLIYEKGTDISTTAIANGLRALEIEPNAKEPKALLFAEMPTSIQWFLGYLHDRMQSVSGLNSIARGDPKGAQSGQMAALFHSIAIEYQSARQAALDHVREEVANKTLDMVRMYADAPFVVTIAGLEQRPYMREFTKEDLAGIRRVMVQTANPMLRSQAGRMQIFEQLAGIPNPEDRSDAYELLVSGNPTEFTRRDRTSDQRVRFENERLSDGEDCEVLAIDDHAKHMRSHSNEVYALTALCQDGLKQMQMDPMGEVPKPLLARAALLKHIADHQAQLLRTDPMLATALKHEMIPPPPTMLGAGQMMQQAPSATQPGPQAQGAELGGKPQPTDSSGIKLPQPAQPPPGSNLQGQSAPAQV